MKTGLIGGMERDGCKLKKILVILFIAFTANCFSQTPLKKPVYWYFIGDTIYASIDGKNEAVLVIKGLNGSSASSDSTSDPGFASKNYVKLLNKLNVKYADSIALMESQYRTNKLLEDYFARIDTQYYYKRAQIDVILNGYQPLIVGLNSAAKTDSNWYEARRDTNKVGHAVTLNHALELFALIATVSFPGFGTSHSTAAYGDHSHNGVYLPVSGAGDIYTHNASEFVTTVTVNDTAHTEAKVKKIIAGSNVTLSPGSGLGDVTINATSGGGGEANTASNLAGLGVGLFKTKIGVDLAFKKLKQLGYIIINDMTDSVAIIPDTSAGKLATKTDLLSKVDNTAIIDTPNIQMTKIEAWVFGMGYVTGTPWTGMGYVTSSATWDTAHISMHDIESWIVARNYVTGTPWTDMGYVTSSATWDTSHIAINNIEAWVIARNYVTGTPWTGMGYVTGTPWTGMGYVTSSATWDTAHISMHDIESWIVARNYVTGTPWTDMGYVTSSATWDTSHIAMNNIEAWVFGRGFVTGTPWTGMGYVTGTPWTSVGYWYSGSHPTTLSGYGITDGGGTFFEHVSGQPNITDSIRLVPGQNITLVQDGHLITIIAKDSVTRAGKADSIVNTHLYPMSYEASLSSNRGTAHMLYMGTDDSLHTTSLNTTYTLTLAADSGVTATGATNIWALRFPIAASEKWTFRIDGACNSSEATHGIEMAVDVPAGATLAANSIGCSTSATDFVWSTYSTDNALGTAFQKYATAEPFSLWGTVTNSTTAGFVVLSVGKVTSGTATVKAGTYIVATRVQ